MTDEQLTAACERYKSVAATMTMPKPSLASQLRRSYTEDRKRFWKDKSEQPSYEDWAARNPDMPYGVLFQRLSKKDGNLHTT